MHPGSLPRTPAFKLSLSLSLMYTHTRTHALSHSLYLSGTYLFLRLTHSLSFTHTTHTITVYPSRLFHISLHALSSHSHSFLLSLSLSFSTSHINFFSTYILLSIYLFSKLSWATLLIRPNDSFTHSRFFSFSPFSFLHRLKKKHFLPLHLKNASAERNRSEEEKEGKNEIEEKPFLDERVRLRAEKRFELTNVKHRRQIYRITTEKPVTTSSSPLMLSSTLTLLLVPLFLLSL